MEDQSKVKIGEKVYSRGEISRGTGISLSHVSRIYSGRRSPSLETIRKIMEFAKLPLQVVVASFPTEIQ